MFDLVIRNAKVADPEKGFFGEADVGIVEGRIAEVGRSVGMAKSTLDAEGLILQAGIIDTHLHLTIHPFGLRMVTQSGVTTCCDMMGPAEVVMSNVAKFGTGINTAILTALVPGKNLPLSDHNGLVLEAAMSEALSDGAFGIKLLGGHFPLSPEVTADVIKRASNRGIYLAFHAGTTSAGSDITGMRQAVELAQGRPFHLAHINAYCRGRTADVLSECKEAAELLNDHPEILTESYLSDRSGCPLLLDTSDKPRSSVVCAQLQHMGFEASRNGIVEAMKSGRLRAVAPRNEVLELLDTEEGTQAFLSGEIHDGMFCGVNPIVARTFFATERRTDGTFLVDSISTDGGSLPRNVIVESGCALMKLGGLNPVEFAAKTALIPARMLGLTQKGRLTEGADADLTLYDPISGCAVHSFVRGAPVLSNRSVIGTGGSILTTYSGVEAVRCKGLKPIVVNGGIPTLDRRFNA